MQSLNMMIIQIIILEPNSHQEKNTRKCFVKFDLINIIHSSLERRHYNLFHEVLPDLQLS